MFSCLVKGLIAVILQHSGLCDVNPGDAVHMDSGETIAQWRKLYFQKFEVRCKMYLTLQWLFHFICKHVCTFG